MIFWQRVESGLGQDDIGNRKMGEHTTITQGRSLCWFGGRLSPWGEWAGIESAAVVWRGGRCRRLLSDSRVPEVSAREMMELFLKMCAQAEHVCSYLLSVRCLGEIRAFDVQDCISRRAGVTVETWKPSVQLS